MTGRRSAIVTGGSRGIGRAVAVQLAADGYNIAFCYPSGTEVATETERLVHDVGRQAFHAPCDVADQDDVDRFVQKATTSLGPVSVLVNSAGIVLNNAAVVPPLEEKGAVIDTNLGGTFNLCRSLAPGFMARRDGVIVNMSSVADASDDTDGWARCSASNAGIQGMSTALAQEVARYGVRVNMVAPGYVDAKMAGGLPENSPPIPLSTIPLRRYGHCNEVATLVSFIVSDRAAAITGKVIHTACGAPWVRSVNGRHRRLRYTPRDGADG
ncbi:SDR family oxidoreductase [Streptomyces sp. NPDC019890]|uniref:SDR family oxidoreductase n=1 Tax=Streptomyces sp. NPDC019890 TaxID=3365064 RepID=UPI00384B9C78